MSPDRRQFHTALIGGAILWTGSPMSQAADPTPPPTPATPPPFERDYPKPSFIPARKKPPLPAMLVEDFVLFAHSDLAMVKKLVEREPRLVVASVDWGAGDWETGLGGASHLGRRDIAEYLLAQGARMDLFCAAMLGLLDTVRGMLTVAPALRSAKGPHGFTLDHHARMGGEAARPILEYLLTLGPEPEGPRMPMPPKSKN